MLLSKYLTNLKGFCCENNLKFLQIYFSWVYNKLYILQNWESLVLFSPFLSNSYLYTVLLARRIWRYCMLGLQTGVLGQSSPTSLSLAYKGGVAPCHPTPRNQRNNFKPLIQPILLLISEWLCCFSSNANTDILRVTPIYFKCSQDHLRVWCPPLQSTRAP